MFDDGMPCAKEDYTRKKPQYDAVAATDGGLQGASVTYGLRL
jgi:hypothetical protein